MGAFKFAYQKDHLWRTNVLFIIIGQARGLKEQSASEGGQGKKAFKNYTKKNNKKKPTKKKKKRIIQKVKCPW